MNASQPTSDSLPRGQRAASPEQTLRRLFLTLFLRGHSSRGLRKESAPKSVGRKLSGTLSLYALIGGLALVFLRQGVFPLSVYLHGMTFAFLGLFVASSAGEVLFNKDEADILLHRPIAPKALLWAKIRVLVEVSLWLAIAFNLVGFFVGLAAPNGGWRFLVAHLVSILLEAVFCTSCVVMVYQLCLRWLGRERLEGMMTAAQVIVSVAAVLSGQLVPQVLFRLNDLVDIGEASWWIWLLPPAWFAGIDGALAEGSAVSLWMLAALAVIATGAVSWIALGKLAADYQTGLQLLNETVSARIGKSNGRRWMDALVDRPPVRWWLRDPVTRASFLLTAAYLVRDRDMKLRLYPGIAPFLVVPIIFLVPSFGRGGSTTGAFGVAVAGVYIGLVPLLGLKLLQYSQQWQASSIFRAAPLPRPLPLCDGARRAILCCLTLPLLAVFGAIAWLTSDDLSQLLLLLPGIIALPVYALVPDLGGKGVPLSLPVDEAKSAGRGLTMVGVTLVSMALAGAAALSWSTGLFWWFILTEAIIAIGIHSVMRRLLAHGRWPPSE